jgi:uncharacterized protein YuzE
VEKVIQMSYNKEMDILYLSVGDPRPAITEELGDDILLRLDIETGEVVGLTVLNFSRHFDSSENLQIPPIGIELHKLIS